MIFLFGTQKSGTTWLRNIISRFVPTSAAYEWQIPRLVSAVNDHVSFCGVRRPRAEIIAKGIAASRAAFSELIGSEGTDVICDKSAYPSLSASGRDDGLYPYHMVVAKSMFPHSKNIQIVRDPRDVLVSSKYYFGLNQFSEDEIKDYIDSWSKCNVRWLFDKPDFVIKFEDLKDKFEETVKSILESIEIDYDKYLFQEVVRDFKNIDRSRNLDPTFYRAGRSGEWRENLSDMESSSISKNGSYAMRIFGYV